MVSYESLAVRKPQIGRQVAYSEHEAKRCRLDPCEVSRAAAGKAHPELVAMAVSGLKQVGKDFRDRGSQEGLRRFIKSVCTL